MKIAFVGKFKNLHDEEYIARSFEMLGHEVLRIPEHFSPFDTSKQLTKFHPNILLFCKWEPSPEVKNAIEILKKEGTKTVCWLFDLYFDYHREYQTRHKWFFKADYVFTTDGGHDERFKELGINHRCVRQGIYRNECVLLPFKNPKHDLIFVGSDNPVYPERSKIIKELGAAWFGKKDTNEVRNLALNELYSESKIVVGDSFSSPYYWSNRVVETLGRGGFLIHQDVPGLKELYPYLVTYEPGNVNQLKEKIKYYLEHEEERRQIVMQNYIWVLYNYTMEKQCAELLSWIK